MAGELTTTLNVVFQKGGAKESINSTSVAITVSGSKYIKEVKTILTTATVIDLTSLSTPGYVVAHNLDSTNYIELSPDGTNKLVKLKPGEWAMFRMSGSTIQAQANTASCNLEIFIVEN